MDMQGGGSVLGQSDKMNESSGSAQGFVVESDLGMS